MFEYINKLKNQKTENLYQEKINSNIDLWPLNAPGMPLPGPDFIQYAIDLGDKPPLIESNGQYKFLSQYGENLAWLYSSALTDFNFRMQVTARHGRIWETFYRGGFWINKDSPENFYKYEKAKIMIIGRCFKDEDFNGNAPLGFFSDGWNFLLENFIKSGISKETLSKIYVTNLVKHRNLNISSARLPVNLIKNCLPILHQELRLTRPDFILCLGSEVLSSILGYNISIEAANGRSLELTIPLHRSIQDQQCFHYAKVFAIAHPLAVISSMDKYNDWFNQIRHFVKVVEGGQHKSMTRDLLSLNVEIIEDLQKLEDVVNEIIKDPAGNRLAVDLEWHGDYPTEPNSFVRTLQFSHKPNHAYIVVFRRQGGKEVLSRYMPEVVKQLKRLFIDSPERKVRLIGHNFRADLPWIKLGIDNELGDAMIKQFQVPDHDPPPDEKGISEEFYRDKITSYGWDKTRYFGGFDTMLGFHAYQEITGYSGFKLESICNQVLGIPRWDVELDKWKKEYCKVNKIKLSDLEGYGDCPDDILLGNKDKKIPSYAGWDVAGTIELFEELNKPGGLLDKDIYGNNCRVPFWISMAASTACLEMEMTGLVLDKSRAETLVQLYKSTQDSLTEELRQLIKWPNFNPRSSQQCIALLFGEDKLIRKANQTIQVVPEGAITLNLTPIMASGSPKMCWEEVIKRGETSLRSPSTDKSVLNLLLARLPENTEEEKFRKKVVSIIRDIRFLSSITTRVLCPPNQDKDTNDDDDVNDSGDASFDGGLLSWVHSDGRIRTHIFQTKETGRFSSTRPPLQNLSKRREFDYMRILGDKYLYPIRSIFKAPPGYVLVEADYIGAELAMMAIQSGDENMIEHCRRSALPDNHPDKFDLHSFMAVKSFKLKVKSQETINKVAEKLNVSPEDLNVKVGDDLPPLKLWLAANGDHKLRDVAKTIIFGIPYGRGDESTVLTIEEEGLAIDIQHAKDVRETVFKNYPKLEKFLDQCKDRVHSHGWMSNWAGRLRRFPKVKDKKLLVDMEREACNFPIQSGVADLLSLALYKLYNYPGRIDDKGYKYKMLLPVHDAIIFAVREDCVKWFVGEGDNNGVLQKCMSGIPVYRRNLDGKPVNWPEKPYYLNVEFSVQNYWGAN